MSIKNQFGTDATAVKGNIESTYDHGSDAVENTKKESHHIDSPLCLP